MQEQRFSYRDTAINVAESDGTAPPLVMLHGVTRRWQTYLPLWSSLETRWRIAGVDFRGHGESDRSSEGYRVCDYSDEVVHFIRERFERPVVLYGHSLGAMVAADVARKASEQVSAVVLEDPPLHTMGDRIGESPLLSYFSVLRDMAQSEASVAEIAAKLFESTIEDPRDGSTIRIRDIRDQASLRFAASCLKRLDPAVLEPIVEGRWLDGYDIEAVYSGVRCPCLLLEADSEVGGMLVKEDADMICERMADATRVRFAGCGHGIHWSETAALLTTVHCFLESVRSCD